MTAIKTLLLAATLPFALPGAAHADRTTELRIEIGDADPATARGRAAIRLRALHAAAEFCDDADPRFGPEVVRAQRQCREAIVAAAMAKLSARPSKAIAGR